MLDDAPKVHIIHGKHPKLIIPYSVLGDYANSLRNDITAARNRKIIGLPIASSFGSVAGGGAIVAYDSFSKLGFHIVPLILILGSLFAGASTGVFSYLARGNHLDMKKYEEQLAGHTKNKLIPAFHLRINPDKEHRLLKNTHYDPHTDLVLDRFRQILSEQYGGIAKTHLVLNGFKQQMEVRLGEPRKLKKPFRTYVPMEIEL